MTDDKCLANRLCDAMGGPTALARYDGPAAVRDAVSSALANMQSDATTASRIARNELTDEELRAMRIVRCRAAAARSRARYRRELPHLRDQLCVKDARLERLEDVLVEFTASIKRLEAKLAELTASVKRLEAACPNFAGAPQSAPFSPVLARAPHPLPGAAGVGGTAGPPSRHRRHRKRRCSYRGMTLPVPRRSLARRPVRTRTP